MKRNNIRFIFGVMTGLFLACVFIFFYSHSIMNRNCMALSNKIDTIRIKNDSLKVVSIIGDFKDKNAAIV